MRREVRRLGTSCKRVTNRMRQTLIEIPRIVFAAIKTFFREIYGVRDPLLDKAGFVVPIPIVLRWMIIFVEALFIEVDPILWTGIGAC